MSGAAGIAAAKNRRSRTELVQKPSPIQSCGAKNKSCPPTPTPTNANARLSSSAPSNVNTTYNPNNLGRTSSSPQLRMTEPTSLIEQDSLKILGPMHPVEILRLHEQRMNRFDERLSQRLNDLNLNSIQSIDETSEEYVEELFTRIDNLEQKVSMLEEVIMNIQNKLTNVQNFAIETNLVVLNLSKNQVAGEAVTPTTSGVTDTDQVVPVIVSPQSSVDTDVPVNNIVLEVS